MNPLRPILAALYALAELVGATLTELIAWLLEPADVHPRGGFVVGGGHGSRWSPLGCATGS